MPLDPNIIAGIGAGRQEAPNLLANYAQMQQIQGNQMALQAQRQAQMLGQIKQQSAQLELSQQRLGTEQQQQALASLVRHGGKVPAAAEELAAAGNPQAFVLQKHQQDIEKEAAAIEASHATTLKNRADADKKNLEMLGGMLESVNKAPEAVQGLFYQARRAQAIQQGLPGAEKLPEAWTPETKQQLSALAASTIPAQGQRQLEEAQAQHQAQQALVGQQHEAQEQHWKALETQAQSAREQLGQYREAQLQCQAERNQMARQRLGLARSAQGGGQQSSADPLAKLSGAQLEMAKKYASGDLKLPPASSRAPDARLMREAAVQLNRNLSDDTYQVKRDFNDPKGKNGANLQTVARIAGHIARYEKNSSRLGFSPGFAMGMTSTSAQNDTAIDAHNIAAELEKLVSGGVGNKEQVAEVRNSLKSSIPSVRDSAIRELSQIVGSQFEGMNAIYKAQTQQDLPLQKYVSPVGREWLKKNNINVSGQVEAAPSPAGVSPGVSPDVQSAIQNAIPKGAKIKSVKKVSN